MGSPPPVPGAPHTPVFSDAGPARPGPSPLMQRLPGCSPATPPFLGLFFQVNFKAILTSYLLPSHHWDSREASGSGPPGGPGEMLPRYLLAGSPRSRPGLTPLLLLTPGGPPASPLRLRAHMPVATSLPSESPQLASAIETAWVPAGRPPVRFSACGSLLSGSFICTVPCAAPGHPP